MGSEQNRFPLQQLRPEPVSEPRPPRRRYEPSDFGGGCCCCCCCCCVSFFPAALFGVRVGVRFFFVSDLI